MPVSAALFPQFFFSRFRGAGKNGGLGSGRATVWLLIPTLEPGYAMDQPSSGCDDCVLSYVP
jgi:hypothetical protein